MSCQLCAVEDALVRLGPWSVIPAPDRAEGVQHHLLIVPNEHVADLVDLDASQSAHALFWQALAWIRDTYALTHYGLLVETGGHAHAEVIVGDVEAPGHRGVRVEIGAGRNE
jgi:hypothetical protein